MCLLSVKNSGVLGRMTASKKAFVLTPRTYEHATLHGKGGITGTDGMKVANHLALNWKIISVGPM